MSVSLYLCLSVCLSLSLSLFLSLSLSVFFLLILLLLLLLFFLFFFFVFFLFSFFLFFFLPDIFSSHFFDIYWYFRAPALSYSLSMMNMISRVDSLHLYLNTRCTEAKMSKVSTSSNYIMCHAVSCYLLNVVPSCRVTCGVVWRSAHEVRCVMPRQVGRSASCHSTFKVRDSLLREVPDFTPCKGKKRTLGAIIWAPVVVTGHSKKSVSWSRPRREVRFFAWCSACLK